MWTTLKKRCPHAHSPNKCKCQPRNNIDQEAALASPHSAHHSQAPRQPAHRFPRGGYKVSGFRVRARIDSYDELDHPAFVVTLDRRSKKRCAAGAGRFAAAVTTSAGDGRAILAAAIGKSISIFTCTESPARTVA